ncbi:hypothetical protein DFH08DRAFT_978318 [Mycena albidolilacea]|uniref:Uncharacterized protein n=1 Tax=Mycena albidolilacea TaxID=1033008 RepID=A0AAD6YZF1_9AGAR|nr:hypothetical protein DFH08DRAFT_978318 [Mycena albidolilacea]
MKGKRKEAAQENENGEVRGVPGMGEKNRLVSWIWLSTGSSGGMVELEMHDCVRAEWCKVYTRVKRWREEVLFLQEKMVRCLRMLQWQAGVWDCRATAAHYNGKIVYGPVHLQGAMALAAKQAAGQTRENRPSRLGWTRTGLQVAGKRLKTSTGTSLLQRRNLPGGMTVDRDGEEEEEEEEEEGRADRDEAETDARRAQMDELLAMHTPLQEL